MPPDLTTLKGRRILIVEDEMLLALDLQSILQANGCVVVAMVPNVDKALKAIDTLDPEAATLDLNLNGEISKPVAEALRARGIPFVVVTGYNRLIDDFDFSDVPIIKKPVDPKELVARLCAAFS